MNLLSNKLLHATLMSGGLFLAAASWPSAAGVTDLGEIPLANSTTTTMLPNIMLDLDTSGSMTWDYMPDYVRFTSAQVFVPWCRGINSTNTLLVCEPGDPPFFANAFNGLAYSPNINYGWPVKADGTPLADGNGNTSYVTPWSAVASDGYGVSKIDNPSAQAPSTSPCKPYAVSGSCPTFAATATIALKTGYPERVWCNKDNATDCKSSLFLNTGTNPVTYTYIYPNATYKNLKMVYGEPYYYNVSVEWCKTADNSPYQNYGKEGSCQAKKTSTYKYVRFYAWSRQDIKSSSTFPSKAASRTDCAGATCTYAEEMSNFANWYAWYRTRIQMAKSAIGLAFKDVRGTPKTGAALLADPDDSTFFHGRVGLTTISESIILNIANFDATQKSSFYTQLAAEVPLGGTPLRTSLAKIGAMYAGDTSTYNNPLQYSCQKNFAILATDGYWNDSYTGVGDTDGVAGVPQPSLDAKKTKNTLADVAYYYYITDLRPGACDTPDLCTDNVLPSGTDPKVDDTLKTQHMVTFTVGLGVDGTLTYLDGYKTSKVGDYNSLVQGTINWPVPTKDTPETIDDLWHAAVNGHGTYFSARDPTALREGLANALGSMKSELGSGAAAATSNLQPTTGDNSIYIATYDTVTWDGEMRSFTVNVSNGSISSTVNWAAAGMLKAKIGASGNTDTRKIYTTNGTTMTRTTFDATGLTAAQLALFDKTKLNQYAGWTAGQITTATPALMVDFIRGSDRYEDKDHTTLDTDKGGYGGAPDDRLYRSRGQILGDIIHSQPIYVKAPPYSFLDPDYNDGPSSFKASNASRAGVLYSAANDGMLHAFNAATGEELWAYVPPIVMPDLWRLASDDYANNHHYFLDGPLVMADAKVSGNWKTVLIGALGHGGRGYYALDVTTPTDPKPLWNFTVAENVNVGYTYGAPVVTKLANDTWVVVVTSGYNNIPEGSNYLAADGKGYVFVLKMDDGTVLKKFPTGAGSASSPSGLAKLNVMVTDFNADNRATGAYGGDLLGNMWHFNLDAADGTAARNLVAFGSTKPIMVSPEIANVNGKTVVFFGTGEYLGQTDLSTTGTQSIYAVKDDGATALSDTSNLEKQTITIGKSGITSTVSAGNSVDWTSKFGWYIDLPESGERVNIEPQLYFGTLVMASTVPSANACEPGGHGWLYQLDYSTGQNVSNVATAGTYFKSPIVGLTVAKLPGGTPVIYPITADGQPPSPTILNIPTGTSTGGVKRVLWRELAN